MTKVVMLTALAGGAFSVQAGEVYETGPAEAASLLEHNYAREFDAKKDAHLPVVECVVPEVVTSAVPQAQQPEDDAEDEQGQEPAQVQEKHQTKKPQRRK